MKLVMSPASPYARKVRVTVREAALDHPVTEVVVATTAMSPSAGAVGRADDL